MGDLLATGAFLLLLLFGFGFREKIFGVLKRFDQKNIARQQAQMAERNDPQAHFRHTMALAEEQVEEISTLTLSDVRTGTPLTRYIFQGEKFATRDEAEQARAAAIGKIARHFYADLPIALTSRGKDKLEQD